MYTDQQKFLQNEVVHVPQTPIKSSFTLLSILPESFYKQLPYVKDLKTGTMQI